MIYQTISHKLYLLRLLIITLAGMVICLPSLALQNNWQRTIDREGGFTISFPGHPTYQQTTVRDSGLATEIYSFTYQGHILQISFGPLNPAPSTPREINKALSDSTASYTRGFGTLVSQEKLPDGGRQYDNLIPDEGQILHMRSRLYVHNGNLYTLSCSSYAHDGINERVAERFFTSFRFLGDVSNQTSTPRRLGGKRTDSQSTDLVRGYIQQGPDRDFAVEFPSQPEYQLVKDPQTGIALHQYLCSFGENHFTVSYRDRVEGESTVEQVSQQAVADLLAASQGWRVIRQARLSNGGYQTELQGMVAEFPVRMVVRVYMHGNRVYIVSSMTKNLLVTNKDVARFFSSFRFI
jgi:hypothetical protein